MGAEPIRLIAACELALPESQGAAPEKMGSIARAASAQPRQCSTQTRVMTSIAVMAKPGDQILVMSNGGFGGVHGKILHALAMRQMSGK